MTVTPSATTLRRFKIWSGIVTVLGWVAGSLLIVSNLWGIIAQLLRDGPATLVLVTLWPLGQGVFYVGFAESLRRHRRELASLDPGALELMRRGLETETRVWQVLLAFVVFNLGVLIVLDMFQMLSGIF